MLAADRLVRAVDQFDAITHAGLSAFNDCLGDEVAQRVVALRQSKRETNVFECIHHHGNMLRFKGTALKQSINRHQ